MARRREAVDRDPHRRFAEWLETNSDEDPPRDLAVHAAVCPGCQQRIAAVDMLTEIDTALAGIPQVRPLAAGDWLRTAGRAGIVVAAVAALVAVGIGSWRLIQASDVVLGPAVASPTQAVLGGTGTPEPTASASPSDSAQPTEVEATPSAPALTPQPPVVAPPATVGPLPPDQPTAQPTPRVTATPRPTRTPAPTVAPTLIPTAVPTPEPTAVPTPEPTP